MSDLERINFSIKSQTLKKADLLKTLRGTTRSGLIAQLINEEFERRAEVVAKVNPPTEVQKPRKPVRMKYSIPRKP